MKTMKMKTKKEMRNYVRHGQRVQRCPEATTGRQKENQKGPLRCVGQLCSVSMHCSNSEEREASYRYQTQCKDGGIKMPIENHG